MRCQRFQNPQSEQAAMPIVTNTPVVSVKLINNMLLTFQFKPLKSLTKSRGKADPYPMVPNP